MGLLGHLESWLSLPQTLLRVSFDDQKLTTFLFFLSYLCFSWVLIQDRSFIRFSMFSASIYCDMSTVCALITLYPLYRMLHVYKGLHITPKLLWLFKWVVQAIHSNKNNTHPLSTSIQPTLCTYYDTIKIWLREVGLQQQSLHFQAYKEQKNGTKIAYFSPQCWILLWISEVYQLTSCLQSGIRCNRSHNRHLKPQRGL